MGDPRVINLAELSWTLWPPGEGIATEIKDPARKLGSNTCGFRLQRLAPGQQASPLHRHHMQEEMFLILQGSGTPRHGNRALTE